MGKSGGGSEGKDGEYDMGVSQALFTVYGLKMEMTGKMNTRMIMSKSWDDRLDCPVQHLSFQNPA